MASILSQTTAEADARLVRVIGQENIPGFKLIRDWPWLAGYAASGNTIQELITTMRAVASYSNPRANNKAYSSTGGIFINSKVEGIDEDVRGTQNRATSIVQTLVFVTSIADHTELADPFIRQNNLIWFPLRSETGESDEMILTYRNLNPASRSNLMDDTVTTDAGLKAIADALGPATYTYVTREYKDMDDGTASFIVIFKAYASDGADDGTDAITTEVTVPAITNRAVNVQTIEKVAASVADTIMAGSGWNLGTYQLLTLRRRNHSDGTATVFQISVLQGQTVPFNTNADELFRVVKWGYDLWSGHTSNATTQRRVQFLAEELYTNTLAHAVAWADGAQNLSSGAAWTDGAYLAAAQNGTERRTDREDAAGWLWGYFTQKIDGDYEYVAIRAVKRHVEGPKQKGEADFAGL